MKHHYVPQFLLSKWAGENAYKTLEIFRLDLHELISDRHTPKYTGYEDNLYALTVPHVAGMDMHDNEELFFKKIDDKASKVLGAMEVRGIKALTADERSHWALFLMSLSVRHPSVIFEIISKKTANLLRESLRNNPFDYESSRQNHEPETFVEWTKGKFPEFIENFGISGLSEFVDSPVCLQQICNMRWWLWDFTGAKHDLLLGDNPLILSAKIDDPNLIFALLISPTKAFMATQSDRVAASLRTQEINCLAIQLNESSVMRSGSRIYAQNKKHWRFIENRKF
ncbi:MAG: DUF4238 domain-containing protein [Rhodobacteraceae bacterium]|nr:DUF4238 domain-containing protein [Paracoccaceae bacterium]